MIGQIRALLVEDEPLALRSLRRLVEAVDWLENVGEARDGPTALNLITELEPDLVFLDVELPGLSGLDVLRHARVEPEVVFTTAYDDFAVPAFELGAIDYLVKPFGADRFHVAVERIRLRLLSGAGPTSGARASAALAEGPLQRLFARRGDRIVPIRVEEIVRIEAQGEYVSVHTAEDSFLIHVSLTHLEERLDSHRFLRVHRSHTVNLDQVVEIVRHDRRFLVRLRDGSDVLASRAGSQQLRELIG